MSFLIGVVFGGFVAWMYKNHGKKYASYGIALGLGSFLVLTLVG